MGLLMVLFGPTVEPITVHATVIHLRSVADSNHVSALGVVALLF